MTSSPNAERSVERLKPNTIDHIRYWASLLTLDNGDPWEFEWFQEDIFKEIFAGYREILVVLPTGNYKTTTVGGFALYHCQFTPAASVPIAASSRKQAGIMYGQASGFVRRSKHLQLRFKIQDGYKHIIGVGRCAGSKIEVFSSSDETGDGIIPTLPILDEIHRQKGELYGTWRDKLTKRDGQLLGISTAGDDENNPIEQLRTAARKLPNVTTTDRHTVARSDGREFVLHDFSLRKGDDPDDLELVKLANPALQVTLEELRMRRDSPTTKRWQWLRMTCNLQSKGENSAIDPELWDSQLEDALIVPQAARKWLGLDLGWKIDHTGITPVSWVSRERRLIHNAITIAPPVDEADIVKYLLLAHLTFGNIEGVVYDPNAGGQQMAQQLGKGQHVLQTDDDARAEVGLPPLAEAPAPPMVFIEYSQDNAPMSLAAVRWDEALRNGWMRHDGSATCSTEGCRCGGLRGHALNAVEKRLGGEKWKYDRPSDAQGERRRKYPTDALTGGLIAHSVAVAEHMAPEPVDRSAYRMEFIGQ
ncbi:MAG: terminase large subunit [Solirubrobacteraceae bacterium]